MGRTRSMVMTAVLVASLLGGGVPRASAAEQQFAKDFGLGMGALGVNIFYMPAKFVYATLGAITGGSAFALTGGNMNVGNSIWKPTLGGTYVVTPAMLRGDELILFSGPTQPREDAAPIRSEDASTGAAPAGGHDPGPGY